MTEEIRSLVEPLSGDSVPPGWEHVRLGDLLELRKAKNSQAKQLPVYTVSNLHGFVLSDDYFDKQVYSRNLSSYKIVEALDFAYNPYRINVGSLALFRNNGSGLVSPAYVVFRVRQRQRLDPEFLLKSLKSPEWSEEIGRFSMSRGSVRRSLAFKDLCSFRILLPPLPEQRAIAHVLRTLQRAKEATENVLAALRELKKSLLRHLFSYGAVPLDRTQQVTLKDTEVGPVPQEWDIVPLGALIGRGPQNGIYKHGSAYGRGTPIVRIDDFDNEGSVVTGAAERVSLGAEEIGKYGLLEGDILVNRVNSLSHLGKTALVGQLNEPAVFESNMMRFHLKSDAVDRRFIFRFLTSPPCRLYLRGLAKRAVAQSSVNQEDVKSIPVPIPGRGAQECIAGYIDAVEGAIVTQDARASSLRLLFESLVHHLMIGKVQLPEEFVRRFAQATERPPSGARAEAAGATAG